MSWITPLDLPCIQPYRKHNNAVVSTLMQRVSIVKNTVELPVDARKQKTAFPPNYVHSLDSTHMLMTSVEMEKRGLTFAAVHDSYWTHASDVDEMNEILRETFVDLYSQPLLQTLRNDLKSRYPLIDFPPVPATGDLDLHKVKDSRYFFQ